MQCAQSAECVSRFSWESSERPKLCLDWWTPEVSKLQISARRQSAVTQITVPLATLATVWAVSFELCCVFQDTVTYQAIIRNMGPEQAGAVLFTAHAVGTFRPVQRISLKFYKQSEAKQSECPGRSQTLHTRLFALSTYVNKCQHVLNTFGFCVQTLQWIPSALSQHLLKLDGRSWSPRCVSRENRARYPCGRGSTCTQHQRSSCMLLLVVDPCPFRKKMQTPFGKQKDIMKIEAEHSWTMIGCPNVRA
jgi:hypothetical protein